MKNVTPQKISHSVYKNVSHQFQLYIVFQDPFYFDVVSFQGGSTQLSPKEMASSVMYSVKVVAHGYVLLYIIRDGN